MKNLLLMMVVVSSFVGQLFCSEKNDEVIVFRANITELWNNPLRYCEEEYVDFLNNHCGIQCTYNEPFVGVSYWQNSQNELIERITFIPLRYFMQDDKDPRESVNFKKLDSILLSRSRQDTAEKKFRIELGTDFNNAKPQDMLNEFKEKPQCAQGNNFDKKGNLLAYMDVDAVEDELCKKMIICKNENEGYFVEIEEKNIKGRCWKHIYVQGPNGYFGEEIKEEQKAEATALFYSRCKKLFGCSLAAVFLMYVLYKKFYVTAG
jgi:hypothetical protein